MRTLLTLLIFGALHAQAPAPVPRSRGILNADVSNFTGSGQDYLNLFFVPGIQRAGGLRAARPLSENRE
jgi:hypothetical protein